MDTGVSSTVDYSQLQALRQVLAPQYAIMPTGQIRAHMEAMYGEGAADAYDEYLEGIFDGIVKGISSAASDVGRFAAKAAPVAATIGGGALQGALSGAQFGLPGIIAGAAIGGTGAGLSKYGSGAARDVGGALSGVTGLASQFSPLGRVGAAVGPAISGLAGGGRGGPAGAAMSALSGILGAVGGGAGPAGALGSLVGGASGGAPGALGSLLGGGRGGGVAGVLGGLLGGSGAAGPAGALASLFGGSSASGQLMSLLQRPELSQALGALNLGRLGRSSIPVGTAQTQVPTAAFPQLMAQLADQVATEAAGWSTETESEIAYMNEAGEPTGDPALPRDRAARLWNLLNEAQAERVLGEMMAPPIVAPEFYGDYGDYADYADARAQDEAYYDSMDLAEVYELSGEAEGEAYTEYGEWEAESGHD